MKTVFSRTCFHFASANSELILRHMCLVLDLTGHRHARTCELMPSSKGLLLRKKAGQMHQALSSADTGAPLSLFEISYDFLGVPIKRPQHILVGQSNCHSTFWPALVSYTVVKNGILLEFSGIPCSITVNHFKSLSACVSVSCLAIHIIALNVIHDL